MRLWGKKLETALAESLSEGLGAKGCQSRTRETLCGTEGSEARGAEDTDPAGVQRSLQEL